MLHDAVLSAHVVAGAAGLLVGPLAGAASGRGLHPTAGWIYQGCTAVLCTTAFVLAVMDPALWGFAVIAVATQAAAAGSVVVRRRRRPGWRPLHAQLAIGSYISFVTAFVVQSAGGLWWVVPVALGSAVTSTVAGRLKRAEQRLRPTPAGA